MDTKELAKTQRMRQCRTSKNGYDCGPDCEYDFGKDQCKPTKVSEYEPSNESAAKFMTGKRFLTFRSNKKPSFTFRIPVNEETLFGEYAGAIRWSPVTGKLHLCYGPIVSGGQLSKRPLLSMLVKEKLGRDLWMWYTNHGRDLQRKRVRETASDDDLIYAEVYGLPGASMSLSWAECMYLDAIMQQKNRDDPSKYTMQGIADLGAAPSGCPPFLGPNATAECFMPGEYNDTPDAQAFTASMQQALNGDADFDGFMATGGSMSKKEREHYTNIMKKQAEKEKKDADKKQKEAERELKKKEAEVEREKKKREMEERARIIKERKEEKRNEINARRQPYALKVKSPRFSAMFRPEKASILTPSLAKELTRGATETPRTTPAMPQAAAAMPATPPPARPAAPPARPAPPPGGTGAFRPAARPAPEVLDTTLEGDGFDAEDNYANYLVKARAETTTLMDTVITNIGNMYGTFRDRLSGAPGDAAFVNFLTKQKSGSAVDIANGVNSSLTVETLGASLESFNGTISALGQVINECYTELDTVVTTVNSATQFHKMRLNPGSNGRSQSVQSLQQYTVARLKLMLLKAAIADVRERYDPAFLPMCTFDQKFDFTANFVKGTQSTGKAFGSPSQCCEPQFLRQLGNLFTAGDAAIASARSEYSLMSESESESSDSDY